MTKILTLDTVKADAEAIINRDEFGPGYVYPQPDGKCVYQYNAQPSCLVGQILAVEGVTIDQLEDLDNGGMEGYDGDGYPWGDDSDLASPGPQAYLKEEAKLELPPETLKYLITLQQKQDRGSTWGEALEAANATV